MEKSILSALGVWVSPAEAESQAVGCQRLGVCLCGAAALEGAANLSVVGQVLGATLQQDPREENEPEAGDVAQLQSICLACAKPWVRLQPWREKRKKEQPNQSSLLLAATVPRSPLAESVFVAWRLFEGLEAETASL